MWTSIEDQASLKLTVPEDGLELALLLPTTHACATTAGSVCHQVRKYLYFPALCPREKPSLPTAPSKGAQFHESQEYLQ